MTCKIIEPKTILFFCDILFIHHSLKQCVGNYILVTIIEIPLFWTQCNTATLIRATTRLLWFSLTIYAWLIIILLLQKIMTFKLFALKFGLNGLRSLSFFSSCMLNDNFIYFYQTWETIRQMTKDLNSI